MVNNMASENVQWQTASPLWEEALKDTDSAKKRFNRPAILRFASDTFMEDLETILNTTPTGVTGTVVQYETWEKEGAGWLTQAEEAGEKTPLRLYHPAHGRFYLVAASLACRKPGLPDKCLDTANKESVSFVMRRLVTESGQENEYGWMGDYGWVKVTSPLSVAAGEERFPLFAMNFKDRDRRRRLLAGLVPVASKETFQAPAAKSPYILSDQELQQLVPGDPFADPRKAQFDITVAGAAEELNERAGIIDSEKITDAEARGVLMWICLDFAEFLKEHLPNVWDAVDRRLSTCTGCANVQEELLFDWLHGETFFGSFEWDDVLDNVYTRRDDILSGAIEDPSGVIGGFYGLTADLADPVVTDVKGITAVLMSGTLDTLVKNALGTYKPGTSGNGDDGASEVPGEPKHEAGVYYIIRCVYERPQCKGLHSPVVSGPTRKFQLASFFEPEAPARPVRITMPVDTSIAGLRKFKKNVSLLISKKLRNQIERMQGVTLGDIDDGKIPQEPGFNLGMICSLSIPIITICALILLMIILQLLNIVFWWLPFFKICFPKKT